MWIARRKFSNFRVDGYDPKCQAFNNQDNIPDIVWSPHSSTCFATVSANGRLEFWDLEKSSLDPAICHNVLDRQFTTVSFATKSATLVTGDDVGAVLMFKLNKGTGENAPRVGLISPFASLPNSNADAARWRMEQASRLTELISLANAAPIDKDSEASVNK
jgi:WD40 repeat protein